MQLHIGESLDSGFDAEPVIGPRFARTRWHRPGMTAITLDFHPFSLYLSRTPQSRHLRTAFRFHEAAAQAAYQVLWLPDERLRCAAHGGHAVRLTLCEDRVCRRAQMCDAATSAHEFD